tara:strand:- start:1640 stop:1894 length:255 start_codon:yes stop_codon:yes gene_type:complete
MPLPHRQLNGSQVTSFSAPPSAVFVVIRVAVQYQVKDDVDSIKNAHYRLTNPKQQIESCAPLLAPRTPPASHLRPPSPRHALFR